MGPSSHFVFFFEGPSAPTSHNLTPSNLKSTHKNGELVLEHWSLDIPQGGPWVRNSTIRVVPWWVPGVAPGCAMLRDD